MSSDAIDDDPHEASDGPESSTPVVHPGDLDALEAAALAAASQWTALATWARRDGQDPRSADALQQLASHADDSVAFTWMWRLITDRPTRANWQTTKSLPEQITVPKALLAELAAELAAPPSGEAARDAGREAIMTRQQPTTPGAIELARAVLAAEADVVPEVGEHAAQVLGASTDRDARDALLTAAQAAPWPQRAQLLTHLQPPLDGSEVAGILGAIDESHPHLLSNVSASDPSWVRVQRLVAVLPTPHQLAVLTQDWLTQPRYADLLVAGPVMHSLGSDGAPALGQLLDSAAAWDVPEPMVGAVLAQLHTLPKPRAVEMAERAHQLLGPERTAAARQHYREKAETYRNSPTYRDRYRPPALVALARLALAEPLARAEPGEAAPLDQDAALLEYAEVLRPGEISELDVTAMSGGQLRRLGAVMGLRLRGGLPHQPGDESQQRQAATTDALAVLNVFADDAEFEALADAADTACAQILAGLATIAAGLVTNDVVVAALLAGPASTAVIARAAPALTAAILHALPDRWPASRTLDVLEAIPTDAAVQAVEELAGALDWDAVDSAGDLPRAAAALACHPRLLAAAVRTAVRSQAGPQTKAAPVARVDALVHAIVGHDSDPGSHPPGEQLQDAAMLITTLVDSPHDDLHELAGHWLASSAPTEELTDLVIRADNTTTPSPYAHARTTMAARLCAYAQDDTQDDDPRIQALSGAQRLDAGQARATALDLIPTSAVPLRHIAAGILAATPPNPGEGDRLATLIEAQSHVPTRQLLERARRRLASGTVGEALTNAVDLIGAQDSFGELAPDICLPDARAHAAFIRWVDQARVSATESPTSRLNAMIVLADLLGEQAIAAYWLSAGTDREKEKAKKLCAGAEDKEDIGFLAIQQNLAQRLGWLSHLAALRASRTAHPTPRGSTTPLELSEADALSAVPLLRRVVEGWVQQMYAAAGQPLPPVAP